MGKHEIPLGIRIHRALACTPPDSKGTIFRAAVNQMLDEYLEESEHEGTEVSIKDFGIFVQHYFTKD